MSDQKKSPSSNGVQETEEPPKKSWTQNLIDGMEFEPDPEYQAALQKLLDDPTLGDPTLDDPTLDDPTPDDPTL